MGNTASKPNRKTKSKSGVTLIAHYREYQPKWKKWEPKTVELRLKGNKDYTLSELKRVVSNKININTRDINLCHYEQGDDKWEQLRNDSNETKYNVNSYGRSIFNAIDISMPLKIRYFHGLNSMYDMIENKNYTNYDLKVFRLDKLFDIIDKNVTKGTVAMFDLVCVTDLAAMKFGLQRENKDEFCEKLVKGYIRSMDFEIAIYDDIIQSIITYRRITKNINVNQTIYDSELYPNCRLILYKNHGQFNSFQRSPSAVSLIPVNDTTDIPIPFSFN